jgi:hypothetical protein
MAKKLRLVRMREAEERREADEKKFRMERQQTQADEMDKMRRDAKYEALMAELQKPKFVPKEAPKPAAVAPMESVKHDVDYKKLMQEYAEKKAKANTFVVDNGVNTDEVVLTPPKDAVVELPVKKEEYVIDNGVQTDAVVVSAAHHQVEAVKDTKGKVHTFTPDTVHNKVDVPESKSFVKPVIMGLGLALTTGAVVMLVLRWKLDQPQDFSGDAPLIENAFGDEAMLSAVDVEAPPMATWASSAVCRALDSVETPTFDIATPR